jgi:hypothetical protein
VVGGRLDARRKLRWGGRSITTVLVVLLAWKQVAGGHLPRWSLYAVLGLVVVVWVLDFPYSKNEDGSPRQVFKLLMHGRSNASLVASEHSTATGNIVTTGKGNVVIVVTPADARQISNDTGRSELLPETRPITMPDAKAVVEQTLNRRVGELTDMLLDRINERDTGLVVLNYKGSKIYAREPWGGSTLAHPRNPTR